MAKSRRFTIEPRGKTLAVICEGCPRPFLTVNEDGDIEIQSKHGSKLDTNKLSPADVHLILVVAEAIRNGSKIPDLW